MPDGKSAKVSLDAASVAKIESTIREALVNASCINILDSNVPAPSNQSASVSLDPATLARFTEHLRKGLVNASCINIAESAAADKETGKI